MTESTRLLQNRCPSCRAMHIGECQGTEERFVYEVGSGPEEYVFFRFPCSGCGRSITLFEAPFLGQRVFWLTRYEDTLANHEDLVKTRKTSLKHSLICLYHPIIGDIGYNALRDTMDQHKSNGWRFTALYVEGQELPEWLVPRVFKTWKVPLSFLSPVAGTKYPPPMLGLNIRNEMKRWSECELINVYPTFLPVGSLPSGTGVDWERVEALSGRG